MTRTSGWDVVTIGDVCAVGDGAHAKIPRSDGGVMYLMAKNFKSGGIELGSVEYIAREQFEAYFKDSPRVPTVPHVGDVLVSIIGTLGEPYVVRAGDEFGLSSSVAILRPDLTKILPQYLYYWLHAPRFQDAVFGIKGGVAQSYLSLTMIRSLPVVLPPLPTQRKIAAVLSAYDDLIENSNSRIKLLEEIAQRIYREWFVDFRYPGHKDVPLVDSELGPIPYGWRVGTLGDLVAINSNTIRKVQDKELIRYIDISSVARGAVAPPKRMLMGQAPGRARRRVVDGDIIWSTVRPNLRAYALLLSPGNDCVASTGFAVLSPRAASFAYIYAMTTTDEFVEYLVGHATGSAYPAVTPPVFDKAPAVIPPDDVLGAYADAGEPLMRLASNLGFQVGTLSVTRDLFLPRLISGEIDVANLDIAGLEVAA